MKIEVKPFNDRVRFTPAITFIRMKRRAGAAKPVSPAIAEKIPLAEEEIIAREQELIALCQSKDFSIEKLRAAIAHDRS
jgi:hypothetical protein